MTRRPSKAKFVAGEPGPGEDPLVGDGGSTDEIGWEAPTRPEIPAPRPEQRNGQKPNRAPRRDEMPEMPEESP